MEIFGKLERRLEVVVAKEGIKMDLEGAEFDLKFEGCLTVHLPHEIK